jgi:ATP-dependent Lon protease
VRRDIALTGEVTLRGKVLEIGGVKEKVLAAYRAGLRHIIMPAANEKDLRDIPDEVRAKMGFTFVSTMDDVIQLMLPPLSAPVLADSPPRRAPRKEEAMAADSSEGEPTEKIADQR